MLPFLQPKRMSAILIAKHKLASGGPAVAVESEEGEPHPGVMQAAEALIAAVHSKDAKAVAEALEDAFETLDSGDSEEPSEQEGE